MVNGVWVVVSVARVPVLVVFFVLWWMYVVMSRDVVVPLRAFKLSPPVALLSNLVLICCLVIVIVLEVVNLLFGLSRFYITIL